MMNIGGVYTVLLFFVCHYTPNERSIPLTMNIGGLYTLPIFTVCPYTPC